MWPHQCPNGTNDLLFEDLASDVEGFQVVHLKMSSWVLMMKIERQSFQIVFVCVSVKNFFL